MSSLGERIKYAREQKGLLQGELAKLINVKSAGVISNWENDLNKPDAEKMVKLCDVLDISVSFLLDYYGKSSFEFTPFEEEYIKKYRSLDSHGQETVSYILERETERVKALREQAVYIDNLKNSVPKDNPNIPQMRLINYYYRLASAGTGQIIFDMPPTKRIEIPDILKYKKADYAIGVNGNSMEPVYYDGDMLLVEMTENIEVGEIGIFSVNNECFVKKLGKNELISLNPDYDNIPLNETAHCMGRVIDKL